MEDLQKAVKRAMRSYWEGVEPENLHKQIEQKTGSKPKYTKKFFDKFEKKNFKSSEMMDEEE